MYCDPKKILTFLMAVCGLVLFAIDTQAARQVSGKRECATCHIMWMDEFKREDVETLVPYDPRPVVETGKQDVSSTDRMCFSCHDGFVEDSRDVWKDGSHSHPVGIEPPEGMVIPTAKGKVIFPLNDEGKMYCGTCHSAHGVDWKSEESPIFLRVKNTNSSMCLACHLEKSAGPKEGSHPIFVQPHETPQELLGAGAQLADDGSVICQSCHQPHAAASEDILVLSTDDAKLCRTCHRQNGQIIGSEHDLRDLPSDTVVATAHPVDRRNPCGNCHQPHEASGPALWRGPLKDASASGHDVAALACLGCHNPDGLAQEALPGDVYHPLGGRVQALSIRIKAGRWLPKQDAVSGNPTLHPLPLFDRVGFRDPDGGRISCATCHNPHVQSAANHAAVPVSPPGKEGKFLRIDQGIDSQLCLNCHLDKRGLLQSPHMRAGRADADAPDSACAYCHEPHNAQPQVLWRQVPQGEGGPIERLCRDCHREDGVATEHAVTGHNHPLGKDLDGNFPSPLPLYQADGTRLAHGQRGLLDCGTCHDPHNWVARSVQTGSAYSDGEEGTALNSFLRLPAAPDSALCTNCHSRQASVMQTDHDMRIGAPHAVNLKGDAVAESGVCGQCHLPHDAGDAAFLWARPQEARVVPGESRCTGCHSREGVAADHIPLKLSHPEEVVVWGTDIQIGSRDVRPPIIPVYGSDGREDAVGRISCPSCHNPHRWDPRRNAPGPGKQEEGDALTSFLRHALSAGIVCADCHGADALFRYKYFHGLTSRREYPLYR